MAIVAALTIMLVVAQAGRASGVPCEKEFTRVEEARWASMRQKVSYEVFQQAIKALASCDTSHDQRLSSDDRVESDSTTQSHLAAYIDAIRYAVSEKWLSPANLPDVSCVAHIVQLPGGALESIRIDENCPYDVQGRHSLEQAIELAQPLPYKGFERVFLRSLDLDFKPPKTAKDGLVNPRL